MTNKECPICLEGIHNKFKIMTPCEHVYCLKCFMDFYETKCPLCRRELKDKIQTKLHFKAQLSSSFLFFFLIKLQ